MPVRAEGLVSARGFVEIGAAGGGAFDLRDDRAGIVGGNPDDGGAGAGNRRRAEQFARALAHFDAAAGRELAEGRGDRDVNRGRRGGAGRGRSATTAGGQNNCATYCHGNRGNP